MGKFLVNFFNPFFANVPILYAVKTPKNHILIFLGDKKSKNWPKLGLNW